MFNKFWLVTYKYDGGGHYRVFGNRFDLNSWLEKQGDIKIKIEIQSIELVKGRELHD